MGVLSDVFIATEAEFAAADWNNPGGPAQFFPTYQSKNVDPFLLEQLETLLRGQTFSPEIFDGHIIGSLDETSDIFFYCFLTETVTGLASLTSLEISHYGMLWASASAEELQQRNGNVREGTVRFEAATEYLSELTKLAQQAQAEGKRMYMWYCL